MTSDQAGAQPARGLSANKTILIIGLTGSISMGKTTIARQFAQCGAAVCDSDQLVHALLGKHGAAVRQVGKLFPAALEGNAINRKVLGAEVFKNAEKLKQLEAILHPMVRKLQDKFIKRARIQKKRVVILDIPLLFETRGEERCNYTIVASAPAFLQRQRAFARPDMTEEKLSRILARQMPDSQKRKIADFIVFTGMGKYNSLKMVKQIMKIITKENQWR